MALRASLVRRRTWAASGVAGLALLSAGVPLASAAYGPIAPPSNLPPSKSAAVISSAVAGYHVLRANLADRYSGHEFHVTVNDRLTNQGRVGSRGRFLTIVYADLKAGDHVRIEVFVGPNGVRVGREKPVTVFSVIIK